MDVSSDQDPVGDAGSRETGMQFPADSGRQCALGGALEQVPETAAEFVHDARLGGAAAIGKAEDQPGHRPV